MINLRILSGVLLFFVCINSSLSQTSYQSKESDSLIKEKIAYIETSFQQAQLSAKIWQYGWLTGYSGLAIGQGINYFISDNKNVKQGMALGVATSLLGVGGVITKPLASVKALETLQKMSENTIEERKIKLQMAENLLNKAAEREIKGKQWKAHLTAGAVNLTSGLIVWLGFKKTIWNGLINFGISSAIAELQIITQPKKSAKAFADYNNKYHSSDAKLGFYKKQKSNWFVGISPVGFRLSIML